MSKINLNPGDSIVTKNQNGTKGIPIDARTQVQYYKDIQNIEYAYENLQVIVTDDDPEDVQHPKGIYVITKLDINNDIDISGIKSLKEVINVTKQDVGLENVDNTSDTNKPISNATQEALNNKQNTISDLEDIRSGASAGAIAVQPATLQGYKTKQTPISDPNPDGRASEFIDSFSQDANGEITVTKKYIKVMKGASTLEDGAEGLVPEPNIGDQEKILQGDGNWVPKPAYVEANPQDDATVVLGKLKIGDTVYTAPQGQPGPAGADAYQPYKGTFNSVSDLQTAFPTPEAGDTAYVEATVGGVDVLEVYDVVSGSWHDTGRTSNSPVFHSGQQVSAVSIVNDLYSGGTGNVVSAEAAKEINDILSKTTRYGADRFYGGSVANYVAAYAIPLTGIKVVDIVCYHTNVGQPCIKLWDASNQPVVAFVPNQIAPADSNGCYHKRINLADYPTATQIMVSKGDSTKDQYLYMIAYGDAIASQYLLNLINHVDSEMSHDLGEEAGIRLDADADLQDNIDAVDAKVGNFNVLQDGNLSTRVKNIESEFDIKSIPSDNGVGGVTNETSMKQGGLLNSNVFDTSRKWYAEVIAKPVNGSQLNFFLYQQHIGGGIASTWFRIHNGQIQCTTYSNGTIANPIIISDATSVISFNTWYHFIVIYDGTKCYLFANGRNIYESEITILQSNITSVSKQEMDTIHSPKLLRIGYLGDTDVVADVVTEHYNGGNPFGYHPASYDNILVEVLPENMTKISIKNTANDTTVTYQSEQSFNILTENPWAAIVEGNGEPSILPLYVGQKYKDLTNGRIYTARGNQSLEDWGYYVTNNELNQLKSQTKTINGQSIWGSGNIEAGGGTGGGTFVNVLDHGAVGDGNTDDTNAIQTALEYARVNKKALYFPNGTFLTRKGFILTSGMRITGEPNAILENGTAKRNNDVCVITRMAVAASLGATTITVNDASKFAVGDEIVIQGGGSYRETMADISEINGNVITIDTSRFTADGQNGGLLEDTAVGKYVLTDFAMIKTIMTKEAVNVVVENITLKPNSDIANEPHIYTSSPINQTRQLQGVDQRNFRVYNVTVLDSANDGISLQGSGESEVIGCRVYNQKHKGIHWGTSHDMIRIENNYVYGCGSSTYDAPGDYYGSGGMFFCVNNHRVIIANNHIENCYRGIYGFNYIDNGSQDTDTVIIGNTFKNCGLYGILMQGGYRANIVGNVFLDFNNTAIPIRTEKENTFYFSASIIANNIFGNFGSQFAGPAMQITGAKNLVINGNNISSLINNNAGSTVRDNCNIVVTGCNKVNIVGNVVDGVIDTSDSDNVSVVTSNNIVNIQTQTT